jgi:hypothetical protein
MTSESVTQVRPWGAGMPAWMWLHEFGDLCEQAFGAPVFLVGSALKTKTPRDIDVRVQMVDGPFDDLFGEHANFGKAGTAWAAICLAFAALGKQMTGKPIDFQVQSAGHWLVYRDEPKLRLSTTAGDK